MGTTSAARAGVKSRRRRERAAAHDALARGPLRRAPVGHQLPPAQAVERHVSGRPALGDGRAPVVGHAADRGAPRLGRGVDRAARERVRTPHIAAMGRPAEPCTGMNVPMASEGDCSVILTPGRVRNLTYEPRRRARASSSPARRAASAARSPSAWSTTACSVLAVDLEPDRRRAGRAVRGGPDDPRGQPRRRRGGARALRRARRDRRQRRLPARRPGRRVRRGPLGRAARDPAHEPVPARQVRVAGAASERRRALRRVASAHGLVASPFKAGYVSAKHGVIGLVQDAGARGRRQRDHGDGGLPRLRPHAAGRGSRSAIRRARTG